MSIGIDRCRTSARGTASRALSLGCALVLALGGCAAKGGGGGTSAGGPPPGGWPQPESGQLTAKMCGLLTESDYTSFGHERLPSVDAKRSPIGPNAIDCLYMTSDELALNLQPTAEAAKLVFGGDLDGHQRRLTGEHRESVLAKDVVKGADESWFDYWTLGTKDSKYTEYELRARRGALLVNMTLSGLKGKTEKDPREVLGGLTQLVLQRIPDVGKTDTGVTHKVRYQVTGTGKATMISYSEPTTHQNVELKGVPLPWSVELPMGSMGQQQVLLVLNVSTVAAMAVIGCDVSVDGKVVTQRQSAGALAFCQGSYTEVPK